MAAISVTPANVAVGSETTTTIIVQAGEAVTQGQPVYRSTSTGKYLKADANDTAAKADVEGIVITPASSDGWFVLATAGQVNMGATLTKGTVYVAGSTAGEVVPWADLTTNDYVTILGVASSTALLDLSIVPTGIQKA